MQGIAVEEFREDMHRVQHRNGHDEYGDHRAHDVDGAAADHQQRHGARGRHHGHDHRRGNEPDVAEEPPHRQEDDQHCQWRRDRHLIEHLHTKGVLRHGQPGDVDLIAGILPASDFVKQGFADPVTHVLAGQRQVKGDCLTIGADQGIVEQRNALRPLKNSERLVAGIRRLWHEPAETNRADPLLLNVVDPREREHILLNHALLPARVVRIGPPERTGILRQLIDAPQRADIEYPVRVAFVDHTHHDHVIKRELLLHVVVENAHGFVGREHVLGVGIDGQRIKQTKPLGPDAWQRRQRHQRQRGNHHGPNGQSRTVSGEL